MNVWKNTKILDKFLLRSSQLNVTNDKSSCSVVILGSKSIDLNEFPNLKGIFRVGVGVDNVPLEEAKKRNIKVQTTSLETNEYIFEETSDFTCYLIFKMLYSNSGSVNPWNVVTRTSPLSSKKLLIVGLGNIGKRVKSKMSNFMDVESFDVSNNPVSDLDQKLLEADCVSLNFPLTKKNSNFFNKARLSKMKTGSVLINTARAGIVCESSLYEEIKNGRLSAAFDVLWQKPYNGKLKEFYPDRFFMTPHVASKTEIYVESSYKDFKNFTQELNND